jgi:hypothetical protein
MSISTFLTKADALKAKGLFAMGSSDIGLLKTEVTTSVASLKAESATAQKAGHRPPACVPQGTKLSSEEACGPYAILPCGAAKQRERKGRALFAHGQALSLPRYPLRPSAINIAANSASTIEPMKINPTVRHAAPMSDSS